MEATIAPILPIPKEDARVALGTTGLSAMAHSVGKSGMEALPNQRFKNVMLI
jgi:hypothetical protein